jgi:hypothetical protein
MAVGIVQGRRRAARDGSDYAPPSEPVAVRLAGDRSGAMPDRDFVSDEASPDAAARR